MTEMDITIEPDGTVRFVYADALAEMFAGERQTTVRASHVEPYPGGGWTADMRPSGGPVLYEVVRARPTRTVRPFPTRQAALDAEREWLRAERGL